MKNISISDWKELSNLYDRAEELDDTALTSYLAQLQQQACPHLELLECMLKARKSLPGSEFMAELPGIDDAMPLSSEWIEGSIIGPYHLLRALGSGGMAEVWLAVRDDGDFARKVALKLPYRQPDGQRHNAVERRFRRERDILASLTHPHIASLLDAGVTPSGQLWLALEYVQGMPLTHWCDQKRLDLAGRVRLFLQVLEAVQHAHTNLVIHRDLKPANVLVTPQAQVQLLDFGIAKLLAQDKADTVETELTRVAGHHLTPRYASPEQLRRLPLSTASDVYSLGVVLYELLCGESAYELKLESTAQLENAILENEVRAPSRRTISIAAAVARSSSVKALRKGLANDLDAIVLKAMGKQIQQRYASVEMLRQDLERWLDGEPVQAKAPSTAYRLRKFVQRNPWGVGLGVGAIASLIAVASLAVVLGMQARQESARALAVRDFMVDLFRQADPDFTHGPEMTAKQLLDQGSRTIASTLNTQPQLQAELLRGLAEAQANMSDYRKADETLSDAARRFKQLGRTRDAALVLVQQADAAQNMGDNARADELLARAVADHAPHKGDAEFMAQYATVQGWLAFSRGDLPKARISLDSALANANQAYGEDDVRSAYVVKALAEVEAQAGASQIAIKRLDRLLERSTNIRGLQALELVQIQIARAIIENASGQFHLAVDHFDSAAGQCEQLLKPSSNVCTTVRNRQLVALLVEGYRERALALVPPLMSQLGADESPRRQAEALLALCRVWALNGKETQHPELWARMLDLGTSGPEVKQPDFIKLWALLVPAESLLRAGQAEAAGALLQRADARFEAGDHADRRTFGRLRLLQGLVAQSMGQHDRALSLMTVASNEYAQLLGVDHPLTLLISVHQVRALWAAQQNEQAQALLSHALPVLQNAMGSDAPNFMRLHALRDELAVSIPTNSRTARKVDFFL